MIYFHIDFDCFFASCEKVLNPALKGKPFGVCADPQGKYAYRSVIASCSYEARAFGVKNGMPPFQARRLCPQIILVKSHPEFYEQVSKKMSYILSSYSDKIFQYGLDEWYVDFTQWRDVFKTIFHKENIEVFVAERIKERLAREIHPDITCSIGIAPTKILAKIASDYQKPNGLFIINQNNFKKVLYGLSFIDIPGIGTKTVASLEKVGCQKIKDLEEVGDAVLKNAFGIRGRNLKNIFLGKDSGFYNAFGGGSKSISRSRTLKKNIQTIDEILSCVLWLLEDMCGELRLKNRVGNLIGITLRYENFETFSRQKKIDYYTCDEYQIFKEIEAIIRKIQLKMRVRLVGIALGGLIKNCFSDLFNENRKRLLCFKAVDAIKKTYGFSSICRARLLMSMDNRIMLGS